MEDNKSKPIDEPGNIWPRLSIADMQRIEKKLDLVIKLLEKQESDKRRDTEDRAWR